MANETYITIPTAQNDYFYEDSYGSYLGNFGIGNADYYSGGDIKGAIYFNAVNVARGTINYAGLYFWVSTNGKGIPDDERDGNWSFKIKAVDEDNTGDFSGANPFGRTQTTATDSSSNSDEPDTSAGPTGSGWKEISVTLCVQEVMNRENWESGNSIALLLYDIDSGCENKYAIDNDRKSFLLIRKSAEPNFKPTVSPVSAPTFPSADNYGIRISYPGYDVKTATENQLYYTSRKRLFKIIAQGKITTTADTVYQVAHGQSYKPFAKAYVKSPKSGSTKRYQMPRYLPGEQTDPDGYSSIDPLDGAIAVDDTYVKFKTTKACEVYYYIFIDELD